MRLHIMDGWTSDAVGFWKPYTPMEKGALIADIESCQRRSKNGFAMVCINVFYQNSNNLKRADTFINTDDLLSKLMDFSLTCSIADVNTGLDDQIMFFVLVETDGSTTNIDADVMGAISKLSFKGDPSNLW